ncbi:carboxypeptidase regulatory-like domain-containing protein [Marinobacterium rhizophilum]|uniref:Carboxypeptidase regulatory-like domain-containing protein n=1 Tax=Marinobacterium rhizophilum TaxID=420402 RepID=A0ABY5HK99_9GAMM|nr:carboxypeptidase-like regulatory domain-containing protein [Marinobacterium rhizophilum]UTW12810.1 carboxypeptidase regulatory-like domain-containing protein [Marinobacterium rhizophilum]
MKSKVIILCSALILSACSSMQGVVRDKETGTPIPSAHIVINRDSGTTNALGSYHVTGTFIPGDTMLINAPGYNIYTRTVKSTNEIVDVDLSKK